MTEMAQTLEAQQQMKKDFVADTRALEMTPTGQLAIADDSSQTFDITPHAHRQIGERIGIPAKYYDRMRTQAPELLQSNVNHWFRTRPEQRMVRTLGSVPVRFSAAATADWTTSTWLKPCCQRCFRWKVLR